MLDFVSLFNLHSKEFYVNAFLIFTPNNSSSILHTLKYLTTVWIIHQKGMHIFYTNEKRRKKEELKVNKSKCTCS